MRFLGRTKGAGGWEGALEQSSLLFLGPAQMCCAEASFSLSPLFDQSLTAGQVLSSPSGPEHRRRRLKRLKIRPRSESIRVRHRPPAPPAPLICYFYFLTQAVKLEAGVNI